MIYDWLVEWSIIAWWDDGRSMAIEMAIVNEVLPEFQSNTWNDHFALSFLPPDSLLPTYNRMSL